MNDKTLDMYLTLIWRLAVILLLAFILIEVSATHTLFEEGAMPDYPDGVWQA